MRFILFIIVILAVTEALYASKMDKENDPNPPVSKDNPFAPTNRLDRVGDKSTNNTVKAKSE